MQAAQRKSSPPTFTDLPVNTASSTAAAKRTLTKSLDLLFAWNYIASSEWYVTPVIYRNLDRRRRRSRRHRCSSASQTRKISAFPPSGRRKQARKNEIRPRNRARACGSLAFVPRKRMMENLIKYLSTHIFISSARPSRGHPGLLVSPAAIVAVTAEQDHLWEGASRMFLRQE